MNRHARCVLGYAACMRLRLPTNKATRDIGTFTVGAVGLLFEALNSGVEKPTLIIAFAGLMGLPLFVRADEKPPIAPVVPPPIPAQPTAGSTP